MPEYNNLRIPEDVRRQIDTNVVTHIYEKSKLYTAIPRVIRCAGRTYRYYKTDEITDTPQDVEYLGMGDELTDLTLDTLEAPIPQFVRRFGIYEEDLAESSRLGFRNLQDLMREAGLDVAANWIDLRGFSTWSSTRKWYQTGKTAPGLWNIASKTTVSSVSGASTSYSDGTQSAFKDIMALFDAARRQKCNIGDSAEFTIVCTPSVKIALSYLTGYDNPNIALIDEVMQTLNVRIRFVDTPFLLGTTAETASTGRMVLITPECGARIVEYGGVRSATEDRPINHRILFDITYGGNIVVPRPEKLFTMDTIYTSG